MTDKEKVNKIKEILQNEGKSYKELLKQIIQIETVLNI